MRLSSRGQVTMPSIVGHISIYDKHMLQLKVKKIHTGKKYGKKYKQILYNQKNKLNENRFYLRTKMPL